MIIVGVYQIANATARNIRTTPMIIRSVGIRYGRGFARVTVFIPVCVLILKNIVDCGGVFGGVGVCHVVVVNAVEVENG